MYCLETSFIIDLLAGEDKSVKKYDEIAGRTLYTTSITAYELLRLKKDEEKIKALLYRLVILDFGFNEVLEAVHIEKELKKEGKMIKVFDILIAAIAKSNGYILVTSDKHFKNIDNLNLKIV